VVELDPTTRFRHGAGFSVQEEKLRISFLFRWIPISADVPVLRPSENLLYARPCVIMESSRMYSTVRMMVKESRRMTRGTGRISNGRRGFFGGARCSVLGFAPGDVSLKPAQFL
jgi:hypothetical protein